MPSPQSATMTAKATCCYSFVAVLSAALAEWRNQMNKEDEWKNDSETPPIGQFFVNYNPGDFVELGTNPETNPEMKREQVVFQIWNDNSVWETVKKRVKNHIIKRFEDTDCLHRLSKTGCGGAKITIDLAKCQILGIKDGKQVQMRHADKIPNLEELVNMELVFMKSDVSQFTVVDSV